MHDHLGPHVVDPEVILPFGAIAQLGNGLLGIFHEPLFGGLQIDAGTDDPVPRFEKLDIGEFGHGGIMPRFGPEIVHRSFSVLAADVDEGDEQSFAVGVREIGQVLAVQRRLHGVHDHPGPHVVDPQVIIVIIAHGADEFGGQTSFLGVIEVGAGVNLLDGLVGHINDALELLPIGGGDFVRIVGIVVVGLNDGIGAFNQVLELAFLFVQHHRTGKCRLSVAPLLKRVHGEKQSDDSQQYYSRQGDKDDFLADVHWRPPSVPV